MAVYRIHRVLVVVLQIAVRLTQLLLRASTEILILKLCTCALTAYRLINIGADGCTDSDNFQIQPHIVVHPYVGICVHTCALTQNYV